VVQDGAFARPLEVEVVVVDDIQDCWLAHSGVHGDIQECPAFRDAVHHCCVDLPREPDRQMQARQK